MQRHGRAKAPFYHIVIADSRAPRDGRFIEKIGTYNPMTKPATIDLNRDSAFDWLQKGAQPTDTVAAILRFKGVMYRKHLTRGVSKGSLTAEEAMEKYHAFVDSKEKKVSERFAQTAVEKKAFSELVFGKAKALKVVEVPVVVAPVVEEVAAPVVEKVVEVAPAPVVEVVAAPVVEVAPAPVVEVIEAVAPVIEIAPEPVVEAVVAPVAEAVVEVAPVVVEEVAAPVAVAETVIETEIVKGVDEEFESIPDAPAA